MSLSISSAAFREAIPQNQAAAISGFLGYSLLQLHLVVKVVGGGQKSQLQCLSFYHLSEGYGSCECSKADYVLALKGNPKTLLEVVANHITTHMVNDFIDVAAHRHVKALKEHGRTDQTTYYQLPVPSDLPGLKQWSGLKTIGVAIRESEENWIHQPMSVTSFPLGVKAFAGYVHGHWSIKTTLLWCLDVTFRGDESRVQDRRSANILAWLKCSTISLLKQQEDKYSIAMRRRAAG